MSAAVSNLTKGIPPLPSEEPPHQKKIVVVGLGMVGIAFLEKLLARDESQGQYHITVLGEEPYLAYNRVGLTEYFEHRDFKKLLLSPETFYNERNITKWDFKIDSRVVEINRERKWVKTKDGCEFQYDYAVMCTGSTAILPLQFFPPAIQSESLLQFGKRGVYVYRTIDDLTNMLQFGESLPPQKVKRAIVVGGGLLGLEAAKGLYDQAIFDDITVVHRSKWLLSQQLDEKGGGFLTRSVKDMGVTVRTGTVVESVSLDGEGKISKVRFSTGEEVECCLLCYTIGIKPRDELALHSGLKTAERGGFAVDNYLQTSDRSVFAIGECASWNNKTFGLIAPGVAMADVLSFNLTQAKFHQEREFQEPDVGTRLKLMGVDVASFGDFFSDRNGPGWLPRGYKDSQGVEVLVFEDVFAKVYKKLIFTKDGKYLLGGILVGDTKKFTTYASITKARKPLECSPSELVFGKPGEDESAEVSKMSDETQVCSCNDVSKGDLVKKIRDGSCKSVGELKSCTKAGTACGGCEPTVKVIFEAEMKQMGNAISNSLCTHFKESRADLFNIIHVRRYQTFKQVMENLGKFPDAIGCEICKPTVGSILSTLYGRHLLEADVHGLQDTNDRFLGNIQRNGTYSVIPRMSGGEITPEKLIAIGHIAKKYDVYTKITGAQRVDLFGVAKQDLPSVWRELNENGFESGQAYGKSLRTVKSCVGSTWCRYGIGDSVGLAIRLEERYKGIRSPHKMKGGVSGCVRDCAEFHSKDFGLCAVQQGFNVYVGGNGGMKPAHAQLLASNVAPDQVIPLLDRYLMFYFRTADRLQRTARWLENLPGGIEYLKQVVVDDKLGLCQELESQMKELVGHYYDEWAKAVQDQKDSPIFKQFINTDKSQDNVEIIRERGQRRPADWPENEKKVEKAADFNKIKWTSLRWEYVCKSSDLPVSDSGSSTTALISDTQIAVFRVGEKLFASQNMCGHKRAFVLSQGIVSSDENNNTYVSCPLHKRNYVLGDDNPEKGSCKNDSKHSIATFQVKEEDGKVFLNLPPHEELDDVLGTSKWRVKKDENDSGVKVFRSLDKKYSINVPKRPAVAAGGCGSQELDW